MYLLLDSPTLNNITDPCSFLILLVLCPLLAHLVVLFINDTLCVHFLNYQLRCSSVTKSLGPHGLQHARPLCPPLSPGICSDHALCVSDAIQPSNLLCPLLLLPSTFLSIRVWWFLVFHLVVLFINDALKSLLLELSNIDSIKLTYNPDFIFHLL